MCPLTRSFLKERKTPGVANNSVSIRRTIAKVLTETLKQRYRSKATTPLSNKRTKKSPGKRNPARMTIRIFTDVNRREEAT